MPPTERKKSFEGIRRPAAPVFVPHDWSDGERCTHDSMGLGTVVRVEESSVLVDFGEGAGAVRRVRTDDTRLHPL